MTTQMWVNLPVRNLNQSQMFFEQIGFTVKRMQQGNDLIQLSFGQQNAAIMLFPEATFQTFTRNELGDTSKQTEVLFSIDASSREEVDVLAGKVLEAGGILFSPPAETDGWLYGCGFTDLDGHRWNVLFMEAKE